MSTHKLCLHHELALLILDDSKGTFQGSMYQYGLAGAILSELLLQGYIGITGEKEQVEVLVDKPSGDPILDEAMDLIRNDAKPRPLKHWVSRVAGLRDLQHRIAAQLADLGILSQNESKILWLFTRRTWPEVESSYEDGLRRRMAEFMFNDVKAPDERTAVLIAFAQSTSVLKANFAQVQLRQHDARIKEICDGKILAAGATKEAIVAVQTAIMAATIASTIAATTAASASS